MRFAQLGGVLAVAALAAAASAVPAAAAVRPRLEGRFAVNGVVTATKGYTGDHKGRQIRNNTYIFTPSANCARFAPCDRVKLTRKKKSGKTVPRTPPVFKRTGGDTYSGRLISRRTVSGCRLKDETAITVRVTQSAQVGYALRATKIAVTFHERTVGETCRFNASQTAKYTGTRTDLPSAPKAQFDSQQSDTAERTLDFSDTSTDDHDHGHVTDWTWDFGDSSSGATNQSHATNPSHTFTSPGTYTVTLTVTDDQGLRSQVQKQVTVAAPPANQPPTANFSAFEGSPGALSFSDQSSDPDGSIAAWSS